MELGGTDQKFNLIAGRELQRDYGQPSQIVLMTPIIEGLDGVQKMSKSLNNAIGIHEPPQEMYGKLMSINDELMWRYWTLLTDLRQSEIDKMRTDVASGALHPMEAKKRLARTIVGGFWGAERRRRPMRIGRGSSSRRATMWRGSKRCGFRMRRSRVAATGIFGFQNCWCARGWRHPATEATRKLAEKAVRIDGETVTEPGIAVKLPARLTVRVGKRAKVVVVE